MKKTVFLDRDGTLIIDKGYLNDPNAIEYLPGVFEALRLLRDHGFQLVVVTNQSGLARGLVQIENLDLIHQKLAHDFAREGVFFRGFYYAPYSVESAHWMRKPNPGMIMTAANEHSAALSESWMVGDRMTDVEAGLRAGVRTILMAGVETPADSPFAPPTAFVATIEEAARFITQATP